MSIGAKSEARSQEPPSRPPRIARPAALCYTYIPMDADMIIGVIVAVAALALVIYLTLWSRRTIDRIANGSARSAREIARELDSDR